ncbi:hypothetical protein RBB50_000666 [Rhinocladiella similis]
MVWTLLIPLFRLGPMTMKRIQSEKVELCWPVGYNIAINQKEFNNSWARFFGDQTLEKQAQIASVHGYEEDRPPGIDELKPAKRTVAFGKIREKGVDEHGFKVKPHQEHIDISAWHRRSGGLVCVDDCVNKTAHVCGTVLGGHADSDFNYMGVFTSNTEQWMNHVASNPAEFDRRFIRSI